MSALAAVLASSIACHLASFAVSTGLVFGYIGYKNTVGVVLHTEFPGDTLEYVPDLNTDTRLCQFGSSSASSTTGIRSFRVMLAQLLFDLPVGVGSWGVWNTNLTNTVANFQFVNGLDAFALEGVVVGRLDDLTWRLLVNQRWNNSASGRCAFECALTVNNWQLGLTPIYDPYVDCCTTHYFNDSLWFNNRLLDIQQFSSDPLAGFEQCAIPTVFVSDTDCLYHTCVEDRRKKRFEPETVTEDLGGYKRIRHVLRSYDFKVFGLLMPFPLLSALSEFTQLLLITYNTKFMEMVLERGVNPVRWTEYAITASLMYVVIGLMSGLSYLWNLLLLVTVNVAVQLYGGLYTEFIQAPYVQKRDTKSGASPANIPFWSSGLFFVVQWGLVFTYFFTSLAYADESIPWFVWTIVFTLFFWFTLFCVPIVLVFGIGGLRFKSFYGNFYRYQILYIILSFISKQSLVWFLVIGLLREQ